MKERIAITGGTGFLGRALVAQLTDAGYQCVVLTRNPKKAKQRLPDGVEASGYDELPDAIDAVYHIAGETPAGIWTPAKKRAIYNSRIDGTRRIVEWMMRLRENNKSPHTLLCASALGIYGHRPGEILSEDASYDPTMGFRAKVCMDWEAEACKAEVAGIRVVRLRISNIIHPEGGYLQIMGQLYRYGLRFIWGDADGMIPWISRTDAVRMLQFALENKEIAGPLHVAAPEPTTQRAFAESVNDCYGRKVWGRIPRWLMRLCMGELARAITDSQDVRPTLALAHEFSFKHPALPPFLSEILKP